MRSLYKLYFFFGFFFIIPGLKTFSQENKLLPDYKQIFGERYVNADIYWKQEPWIHKKLLLSGIDPDFAKAIVFPELMRFSTLQNIIEMQGLLALYVQYGEHYSNFSVGRFQMKPTFAKQLEKDAIRYHLAQSVNMNESDGSETSSSRLSRVCRLNSQEWQVQYLVWFIEVMDRKYIHKTWSSSAEKIKFYATAYNCGYTLSEGEILKRIPQKHFHISTFNETQTYCYSDISAGYFRNKQD